MPERTLVDERKREAGTLVALRAERASVAVRGLQIETEAAPIRYVAELVGADTDSERAIRCVIARPRAPFSVDKPRLKLAMRPPPIGRLRYAVNVPSLGRHYP